MTCYANLPNQALFGRDYRLFRTERHSLRVCRSADVAADLTSNGDSWVTNDRDKLQMRENPRRLFVRDPLPGTEPVSCSQGSPPRHQEPHSGSDMPHSADGHAGKAGQPGEARTHDRLYGDSSAQAQQESRSTRPLSDAEVGTAAARAHVCISNAMQVSCWECAFTDWALASTPVQVSEMLPKLEASSELSVQPSLAQLAGMAREDAKSLAEVLLRAAVFRVVMFLRVDKDEATELRAFRLPILRSSSRE